MLSLKLREKNESMLHCVFQEFTLIVAVPEITGNQVKSYNVRKKERTKKRKKERKLYLLRVEYINYRWPGSSYNIPQKRDILIKIRNILLILKNPTIS